MTERSTAFEHRVERIHRLLEGENAVVTWNDHIPDPDNPNQPRQIDVTIRRAESFTIVECRIHKDPQDVTWIEELMGRRASLRADTVIAVSNSGFTQGAESKANQFGIILRDFNSLTQDEIRNWGKQRKVQILFYEFTENLMTLQLPNPPVPPISIADYRGRPVNWRGIFEPVMRNLDDDRRLRQIGAVAHCNVEFDAPIFINGVRALKTTLKCDARPVAREVLTSSLVAYADPLDDHQSPHALVGGLDLGTSEIIEIADRVTLVIDLTQIQIPQNCLFHTILYDFGRVVEMRGANFIGAQGAMNFENSISFQFEGA